MPTNLSLTLARQTSLYGTLAERTLPATRRDLAALQEQVVTGRRVNRASDDPSAFGQARRLEALERRYEGFQQTVGEARLWTDTTQDALDDLAEIMATAQEELVRANTDALSDSDRATIADKLRALLAETVDTLNRKVGDEYLFAGNRTDAKPFNADGTPTTATLADLGGARHRAVAPDTRLQTNVSGAAVQDTGDGYTLTQTLTDAITLLEGGTPPPGPPAPPATLDEALGRVTAARDHVLGQAATIGETARRLETVEGQLYDAAVLTAGRRSEVEDTDMASALMQLQQKQGMLEAALRVTASANQTSLLDYLR